MSTRKVTAGTVQPLSFSEDESRLARVLKKIDTRIISFLAIGYMIAYLDRINIGFAQLQMRKDVGITDEVFGFAAGIFFLGYVLFELPSNLLLVKIGARRTIARIMVLWGFTSASMLFVDGATKFYVLRFLLGVFEAGFAPGMIYYLTLWYPAKRMAAVYATVMLLAPVAAIIAGPTSGFIMSRLDGVHGLGGWQWMFLLEGVPAIVFGVVAFFYLTDSPDQASWLDENEKQLVKSYTERTNATHGSVWNALKNPQFYVLSVVLFGIISGSYVVSFWLPSIIKASGIKDVAEIGMYSAIPYVPAAIAMIVGGRYSDKKGDRKVFVACVMIAVAFALAVAALAANHFLISFAALCVAAAGSWTAVTTFWAIPSTYFTGAAAAGAIALINSVGLLGGFSAPSLIGVMKTLTGNFQSGLLIVAGVEAAAAAVLLVALRNRR